MLGGLLHHGENSSLNTIILNLLGGRLLVARVLLVEKLNLMLDESHEVGIGLHRIEGEKLVETVALGNLLSSSRGSHSINSFLVFETVLVFDVVIVSQAEQFVNRFCKFF